MKTVLQYFKKNYRKKYESVGYLMSESTFLRVRGDIVQTFTLKPFQMGDSIFNVDFGIFPMCMPQPVFFEAGAYMLNQFFTELPEGYDGWRYDPHSDVSICKCAESVSRAIDQYLLPFFESVCNCQKALPELLRLEALLDNNRKRVLRLQGWTDSAKPWQERSLFDYRKYYIALKAANWDYAKKFLVHMVRYYQSQLQRFDSQEFPRQPDIVKKRDLLQLALWEEQLNIIQACNYRYFTKQLSTNETQMREFLKAKYPKLE